MNRIITIFQMAVIKSNNDIPGLIFSSELDNYQSQFFQFCLPIHKNTLTVGQLINALGHFDIYMPFAYKNETINIKAKLSFPIIEFNLLSAIGINQTIKFEIELTNYNVNNYRTKYFRSVSIRSPKFRKLKIIFSGSTFTKLNYIGNWSGIDKKETQFILLKPSSLKSIEECYHSYNLIPIGTTLNFGLHNFKSNEIDINLNRNFEK
jgi:hypothetical protein